MTIHPFSTVPETGRYYTAPGELIFPLSDPLTALALVEEGLVVPSAELIMKASRSSIDEHNLATYSKALDAGFTELSFDEAMLEHERCESFRESLILTAISDFIESGCANGNLLEGLRACIKGMDSIKHLIQHSKRVTLHGPSAAMQTFHSFIAFLVGEQATILSGTELRHGVLPSGRGYAGELHFTAHLGTTGELVRGVFNPSRTPKSTLMHEAVAIAQALSNSDDDRKYDATVRVELSDAGTYRVVRAHDEEAYMEGFIAEADEWYTTNLQDVKP